MTCRLTIQCWIMMPGVDEPPDAITKGAADKRVRQEVVLSCKPSNANQARQSISGDLHGAVILIFVCNHGSQGPGSDRMSRRKRLASVPKFAGVSSRQWTLPLTHPFQSSD